MGLVLQDQLGLEGDLMVIVVMDFLAIIIYLEAVHSSQKKVHRRGGRIFLRLIMSVMTFYGPARVLSGCKFHTERLYNREPGVQFSGTIQCPEGTYAANLESNVLSSYFLLRARSIVTLTLATQVMVEMIVYMWSAEGRVSPQDVELAAPIDMGMGTTSHQRHHPSQQAHTTSAANPAPMLTDTPPSYSP
ncbi:hypothetical protein BGZ72_009159 [Mortierella alpina]|nr:hypothetical protein BGZ72_009159 [Mortierella alpina]